MKKVFICMFVVALLSTSFTLRAQEVETTPEAQAVEPIADTQSVVIDGVALEESADALPVGQAQPIASDTIYDSGVVADGIVAEVQPVQAFDSSCCNTCCEPNSFVQPVVFNQPVVSGQPIIPQVLPTAPAQETFAQAATTFTAPVESQTFAATPVQTFAPAQTFTSAPTFVSAPVTSAPRTIAAPTECCNCQSSRSTRLFRQRGLFTRLRNGAISSAINNDN